MAEINEPLALEKEVTGEQTTGKTDGKTTQKTTRKTTQRILEILRKNPHASREEIAQILGDITADGVKYQLDKMKREKIIQRIGPAKGGYWDVIK